MASPPDHSSILNGSISSSPKAIRSDHSPVRHRQSVGSEINEASSRPRLSPTLSRSYNPSDPDALERQRAMDADMAMQLSRARSGSVAMPSPIAPAPHSSSPRLLSVDEPFFPTLSLQEQQAIDEARGLPQLPVSADRPEQHQHLGTSAERDLLVNHLSSGHDPALLVSLDAPYPEDTAVGGLPMYQATMERTDQPRYEFSLMEDFARDEKARLGIHLPVSPLAFDIRQPQASSSTHIPIPNSNEQSQLREAGEPASQDSTLPFTLPRTRHRKLSVSSPAPRRSKMALFEQGSAPPPALTFRAPHLAAGTTLSAVPSYDNLDDSHRGARAQDPLGLGMWSGPGSGHDRPYRFSFYSNALSATIHARSLSELPADGQSFEDLFQGANHSKDTPNVNSTHNRGGVGVASSIPKSEASSPTPPFSTNGISSVFSKPILSERRPGEDNTPDTYTWWLDVLSPTDEEMKLLSKVFSIHPLTTEDIQMEETREKIELFRNYYFVCFRGFDQDPYSPTHLEPLNMYIIVFRDGILSFHFRPTPHPQNVRRRIKQLKDYISVTSDWISYALIDDITDAFGPLIQSIEYEVDSIDELVLILKEAEQSDMLRRIGTCRKKVMGLLRLMGNKADVVKGLAKRCNENWRVAPTSDIGLYLSDIQDHLITMTQNLNHYEKILSRSHSNYLAQISIEMTDANNQINDVLSKLTALGTVLIPMNLITGLWGMNVHVPGQEVENLKWFGSIIAALAAFAVIAGWSTYKLMVHR